MCNMMTNKQINLVIITLKRKVILNTMTRKTDMTSLKTKTYIC